jgi:hypothetical protein
MCFENEKIIPCNYKGNIKKIKKRTAQKGVGANPD